MTNEEIILKMRLKLLESGKIKACSTFTSPDEALNLVEEPYPELIYTRGKWWEKGRRIRDGEKGFIITLWGKSGTRYYTYKAKFYAESQTEPIAKEASGSGA